MKYICHIILFLLSCINIQAQINFTDYQNPFPQTYLGMGNGTLNEMQADEHSVYIPGVVTLLPQEQPLIFKKNVSSGFNYKIYSANQDTRLNSMIIDKQLKNYYAFITTDITTGCTSAGLKVLKLDKNNLSSVDSMYFCDSLKPSGGAGYFFYNHFYVNSFYGEYYQTYSKTRNLVRRIDTNLVLKNEEIIGDTSVTFGTYCLRQGCDDGIIMNTLNQTEGCPMLIKLDTLGTELWRKNYYTTQQTGGCNTSYGGIMGLQNYQNGYIALFNASNGGMCSYFYSQSIMAKLDKNGNLIKEVQYTTAGDTTLEFYSNLTNHVKRTFFYNMLIKTNDGNYASVIRDREKYGFNNHENYIVILDTNLNIIHRSPPLGSLNGLDGPGLTQGADSTFYLGGGVMNSTNDGMNVRIYTYKPGGAVGVMEYGTEPEFKLYPNPSDGSHITIEYKMQTPAKHNVLQLYDVLGHLVLQNNLEDAKQTIDVSPLGAGVYLYRLTGDDETIKQGKLVISR
jgi:hypothetical protein